MSNFKPEPFFLSPITKRKRNHLRELTSHDSIDRNAKIIKETPFQSHMDSMIGKINIFKKNMKNERDAKFIIQAN